MNIHGYVIICIIIYNKVNAELSFMEMHLHENMKFFSDIAIHSSHE